ncbi:MAG: (Fe-S)-binding protein [Phycisphaerae bacterium]|nr:(Fe-S)-binding protein [Gemmatimonadaceae bacterium]
MGASNLVFAACLVVALAFFARSARRLVRWLEIGHAEDRTNEPALRTKNLITIGFLQSKILRDPLGGAMHAFVFWGFCILGLGTAEIMVQGLFSEFSFRFLPNFLYVPYVISQEIFAVFVLVPVAYLLYRRIVIRPRRFHVDPVHGGDAIFILSMIAALMISLLLMFAMEVVQGEGGAGRVISGLLAKPFMGMSHTTAHTIERSMFWFHALLILYFLNHLPGSKHLHVLTSLINVWFSNTSKPGTVGAMRPMDLEGENVEQFGASDVEHLSWKNLLDGYSCTECGRCTAVCPANVTGKALSPRMIVVKTRARLTEKAKMQDTLAGAEPTAEQQAVLDNKLLDNWITEEELWACTSCRACVEECPVSIDQLDIINELRRDLVLMESRFPDELAPALQSLERNGSPWAFSPSERAGWAQGMEIPTVAEVVARGEKVDLLFWVGCMGSFDDRSKKTTVAFARIMQAANVKFAILGQEETCHGDPARRMGNEYLYQTLAKGVIETLNGYEIKTIVTSCPHCFHQMGSEFPDLGGQYEVIHHSQYIERLLAKDLVPLSTEHGKAITMAYHDSCYLGRYNDVYEEPRATLRRALPVVNLVEPARTKSRGLCCGAGGGRMWMEETVGKRINVERTEELLATGADTIAVACPFCMTMISDGVSGAGRDVPVLDIAEVVAGRLAAVPVA